MNAKQIKHYLKGGKFRVKYNPIKTDDIGESIHMVGKKSIAYQNVIIAPIVEVSTYEGQHAFNVEGVYGWVPEQDIEIIGILEEYIKYVQPLPQYMYRSTIKGKENIKALFGKGYGSAEEMIVGRSYSKPNLDWFKEIQNNRASKIEQSIYTGETEELVWEDVT